MKPQISSAAYASLFGLVVLSTLLVGCRPKGQPSAADFGTKAEERKIPPSANATTPSTGTDVTGRPSGPSGGTTGSDPAESAQRAGAGGGPTASSSAAAPAEQKPAEPRK